MEQDGVSAEVPDWSREAVGLFEFAPGRKLLKSVRDYQRARQRGGLLGRVRAWLAGKRHRIWTIVSGAEIPLATQIGGGLLMPHPNGIVIHPDSVIGPNCLFMQQVTLGVVSGRPPIIEGHVDIGAGAKIIGAITVGKHARVGANAVVVHDVRPGATVVGIPAREIGTSAERGTIPLANSSIL